MTAWSGLLNLSWQQRKHLKQMATRGIAYPLTTVLALVFALPFLWMVSLSLKTEPQIHAWPPVWIPNPLDWANYPEAIRHMPFLSSFKNTVFFTALGVTGEILSSSLVAFGFARLNFIGRNYLFVLVLSTMMLPSQVTLIPQYILFRELHWIDSFKPLLVPSYFGAAAFYIFLLRQFFLTIPLELDEAAYMDGASAFTIYRRVVMPLATPILVTIIAFSFIRHWNDFFGPLIYLNSVKKMVLAVILASYRGEMYSRIDLMMALATMMLLPVVIVFFFCQRYFIAGITMTGLREG